MVQRLIKESKQQKEPRAPKHDPKQELGQSGPIAEDTPTPASPPKSEDRPSWMAELMTDSQPPKQASAEDEPATSNTDLFETAPDATHEVWAKLDESERRKKCVIGKLPYFGQNQTL